MHTAIPFIPVSRRGHPRSPWQPPFCQGCIQWYSRRATWNQRQGEAVWIFQRARAWDRDSWQRQGYVAETRHTDHLWESWRWSHDQQSKPHYKYVVWRHTKTIIGIWAKASRTINFAIVISFLTDSRYLKDDRIIIFIVKCALVLTRKGIML